MQSNTIISFARQQGQHISIFKAIQMSSFNDSYFYIWCHKFHYYSINHLNRGGSIFHVLPNSI